MNWVTVLTSCGVGYFVGSLSFARLIARIRSPSGQLEQVDLAVEGSDEDYRVRAVSASAVSLQLGSRWGFAVMALDMLKIVASTLLVKLAFADEPYFLITAVAGMVGHVWPVYHGFRGGRGVTAVYGGLWVIDWIAIFATFVGGMFLGIVVLRNVVISYFLSLWLLIPWFWVRTRDWRYLVYAVAVNLIFIAGMIPDLKEYVRFTRMGVVHDPNDYLRQTAMGRGMLKVLSLLEGERKKPGPQD
jgi:glycerol-3-phosphate acyltransferase PlsY